MTGRRLISLPELGDYYIRSIDQAAYRVTRVFTRDRQVRLDPCRGGAHVYAFAPELASDWERVLRWSV